MKNLLLIPLYVFSILFFMPTEIKGQTHGVTKVINDSRVRFQSIDIGKTSWTEGLMKDIWKRNAEVTIPYLWQRYNSTSMAGYAVNFQRVANGNNSGYLNGGIAFSDGDFYKWMEAACYVIALDPGSAWVGTLDNVIGNIAASQERALVQYGPDFDGYISTYTQLNGGAQPPFSGNSKGGEVYNFGHLMTTASIHHRVTGDEKMLNVAKRTGHFLWRQMQRADTRPWNYWDHTSVMGAAELYRETGDTTFLNIAKFVVDEKGNYPNSINARLNSQVNGKLINQSTAVGHAQRANYLYAGAIDAYIEGADTGYIDMGKRIWDDITTKKMYVTGGTGSVHGFDPACDGWTPGYPNPPGEPKAPNCNLHVSEAYGPDYYLPNEGAYNEGCAQCGMALYAWRMLQATGESKYADVLELEYLNGILGGVSLSGDKFFYTNKLERLSEAIYQMNSRWRTGSSTMEPTPNPNRATWTQCCPPNYARLLAMSPNLAYGISEHDQKIWVHLFGSNTLETKFLNDTEVAISQSAPNYPWSGDIKLIINKPGTYGFKIRIPGWSENTTISINGEDIGEVITGGSYYVIENRLWDEHNTIEIALDMEVRIIEGNHLTGQAQINKVAIKKGPLVYSAERIDNPISVTSVPFSDLALNVNGQFNPIYNEPLKVWGLQNDKTTLIPYFAWSNRSDNYMKVWLKKDSAQSTEDKLMVEKVRVYPNPAHDHVYVLVNEENLFEMIDVYNIQGRLVIQQAIAMTGAQKIDLSTLTPGVYIIKLSGRESMTNKLLIK